MHRHIQHPAEFDYEVRVLIRIGPAKSMMEVSDAHVAVQLM
jgi:hypothetical protein